MSAFLTLLGWLALIAVALALPLIYLSYRRTQEPTDYYQYVEIKYEDGDRTRRLDGWVDHVHRPRGGAVALDWARTDDRTELPMERVVTLERYEWVEVSESNSLPPDGWEPAPERDGAR